MTTQTVFVFDADTGKYKYPYDAQESPLEPGEFIKPVSSTLKAPPTVSANQAAVFSVASDDWSVVPDFCGQTFYDQTTGAEVVIELLGAVPSNLGASPPPPPPPTTEQLQTAALAKRDGLLATAAIRIAPLQDAADLEIASAEEQASLTAWKQYRVALNRIIQQTGYPQSIIWPQSPE